MSEWAAKRFWKAAKVVAQEPGFAVLLDGRAVKTPAKTALIVPTEGMAQEIAAEWDAQEDRINPLTMPFTRSANAALDKVRLQQAEVAAMLAAYGDSDLLCYRADSPEALVSRQAEAWDPLLDWAAARFGARLIPRTGVMHSPQDAAALTRLAEEVQKMTAFQLAAFHDLVGLSGSLVLALAVADGHLAGDAAWPLSRIDETWQEEQWGADEEASAMATRKQEEFLHAERFYRLSA
mgnify:CR=1 FL=1